MSGSLPAGFTLDQAPATAPGLPEGFTLDAPPPQGDLPNVSEFGGGGGIGPSASFNTQPTTPGPLDRMSSAAVEGYRAPPFLTPEADAKARNANNQTWVGRNVVQPLVDASEIPFRAMNALGAGMGQGAYEAGAAIDPRLGRDAYMVNQLLPAVGMETPYAPRESAPQMPAPGKFVSERMAPPPVPGQSTLGRINDLIRHDDAEVAGQGPGMTAQAAPEPSPPVAQNAGAAASRDNTPQHMLTLLPAEEQAYRSTAEGNKLLETQEPSVADRRQLIPGVRPNTAEMEQSVQAARELKSLKIASPALGEDAAAAVDANNSARQNFYGNLAGSKVTLQNAIDARSAQAEADLAATWGNKSATSPQPVLDAADNILQSPDGRRPAVRNAVNAVTAELYDADGNPITDPEMLYGVRKHIGDMLSKENERTTPLAARARANLLQLQSSLDNVIENGAPNFRKYLDNFSTASRPIDAMTVLQDHESGLYGAQNRMEYARFQRFMRGVVDARSSPGVNPYKSIPDETMAQLWNLRDDLRRSSAAVELARTAGSDTAQNLMDVAKHGLARGVGATIGGTLGTALGPIGTGVGASVGAQAGERFMGGRAERRAYQRGQQLLYPRNSLLP